MVDDIPEEFKQIANKLLDFIVFEEIKWSVDICHYGFGKQFADFNDYPAWAEKNKVLVRPSKLNDLIVYYIKKKNKDKYFVYGWAEFGVNKSEKLFSNRLVREKPLEYSFEGINKLVKL